VRNVGGKPLNLRRWAGWVKINMLKIRLLVKNGYILTLRN